MCGSVAEVHECKQFFGTLLCLAVALSGDESRNHDILDGCELRQQLMELEHKADVLVAEVGELFL